MDWRKIRPAPLEWMLLGVGVVLTIHYAWILDDAYVYYRYVENFLEHGFGWVYNEGEYVEGYTSPLWLLLITSLRTIGLEYWFLIRAVGVLVFALFWWGLVVLGRDLSAAAARDPLAQSRVVNLPMLFLVPNYATLCYFTSGVEAPLANLAAVAFALFLVRPERRTAGFLVAASPLVRPELALALVLAAAFVWYRHRRFPLFVVASAASTTGAWLLFRITYYADLLPNTFYLKHESLLPQGLAFLQQSLVAYAVYPLTAAVLAAVIALRRRNIDLDGWVRIAMLAIAFAITCYVVRIGGDPRHHRYLAFSFCLAACATAGIAEHVVRTFAPTLRAAWVGGAAALAALGFAALYPPQLSGHPLRTQITHFPVALVNDAHYHRTLPGLSPPAWSLLPLGAGLPAHVEPRPGSWHGGYAGFDSSLWCFEHYWQIHRGVTHGAGLTDAFLARTVAKTGRPAHKPKLAGRAKQISALREHHGASLGMFGRAVAAGNAPPWVEKNLESLELIERKIYNEHDFGENLALALTPIPKIR